jgi:hypothetical protein
MGRIGLWHISFSHNLSRFLGNLTMPFEKDLQASASQPALKEKAEALPLQTIAIVAAVALAALAVVYFVFLRKPQTNQ